LIAQDIEGESREAGPKSFWEGDGKEWECGPKILGKAWEGGLVAQAFGGGGGEEGNWAQAFGGGAGRGGLDPSTLGRGRSGSVWSQDFGEGVTRGGWLVEMFPRSLKYFREVLMLPRRVNTSETFPILPRCLG
jgi:hypothetical protein